MIYRSYFKVIKQADIQQNPHTKSDGLVFLASDNLQTANLHYTVLLHLKFHILFRVGYQICAFDDQRVAT